MNIIEAIKSGKRFRHSLTGTNWYGPIKDPDSSLVHFKLDVNQLVSNDWEIEEVRVTITYSEFDAAWKRVVRKTGGNDITYGGFQSFRDLVARELGL